MLNPALTVLAFAVVTALIGAIFDRLLYGIVPGLIAGGAAWYFLGRRVMGDLDARMRRVQEILQPPKVAQNPMNPGAAQNAMKAMRPKFDAAIALLDEALVWRRWHPFVAGQIEGQIGYLYFLDQRFVEAQPHLERSTPRNWIAMAALGVIRYKRKQQPEMVEAFEKAVKHSPKESLLWNLYAWCLNERGDRDAAIAVLVRAQKHVATDERTLANMNALSNSKAMKMKPWAEMWYQFHLEKPEAVMAMPQRPMSKRALYRGRA